MIWCVHVYVNTHTASEDHHGPAMGLLHLKTSKLNTLFPCLSKQKY